MLIMVGLPFFWLGYQGVLKHSTFIDTSQPVTATVIEVHRRDRNDGPVFRPVFEIVLPNGETRRYIGDFWEDPPTHYEGDVVSARYSKETGEIWSDELSRTRKIFGYRMSILGGGFAILGIYLIWLRRKEKRNFTW